MTEATVQPKKKPIIKIDPDRAKMIARAKELAANQPDRKSQDVRK